MNKKFKINANKEQLSKFGIDDNIYGLIGELTYKYPTGWYQIKVPVMKNGDVYHEYYDIPKTFLIET